MAGTGSAVTVGSAGTLAVGGVPLAIAGVAVAGQGMGNVMASLNTAMMASEAAKAEAATSSPSVDTPAPAPAAAGGAEALAARSAGRATTGFIDDVTVVSRGKVIGRGTVDVRATVEGIQSGKLSPRDIFQNREGLLPKQGPGYYQEFVHPTPGVSGAGPQRIISGQGGELYYTPDHYKTFIPLN
jgi:guanyl-specific ribonuclease Sa